MGKNKDAGVCNVHCAACLVVYMGYSMLHIFMCIATLNKAIRMNQSFASSAPIHQMQVR